MKFKFSVMLVFIIGVLALANLVSAQGYSISDITINGLQSASETIYAERGETLDIAVKLNATADVSDVRIKAWIGGYEFGDVQYKTGIFDVESGVNYIKKLNLEIPDDIDASKDYTLNIEVYDDQDQYEANTITLRIQETRHLLKIQDVILRPSTEISAGKTLFATVRVENTGDRKEEDIKVTVSIPELGISNRDYIDELVAEESSGDDEETSASSNQIYLTIPSDAKTGTYNLKVDVEYNKGHDIVSKTEIVNVKGVEQVKESKTLISIDTSSQKVEPNEQAVYKIMFSNLGKEKGLYSVEVSGAQPYADVRVDPAFITVASESTGEIFVYLKAKQDAEPGVKMFTVKVLAEDKVVKEANLNLEIAKSSLDAKTILMYVFIALIVILIIVGILAIAMRKKPEAPLEGSSGEQTYY